MNSAAARQSPHWLPPALALTTAAGSAVLLWVRFLASPRLLWSDAIHDRHAHLYSGLCLASDVAHGRIGRLFSDVDAFRSWPPLHDGLFVGAALLLGRGDERWAVLPSLLGWAGAAVFAALLARRALGPGGGTVAGLLAALFVLVSPAQRAFATDVMLESLGACLTLVCLFCYVRVRQDGTAGAARGLALALSALFFHKYNYWLLAVFGLGADWLCVHRGTVVGAFGEQAARRGVGLWVARQLRHPLSWVLAVLAAAIIAIGITGGADLTVFGRRVSVHSGANLLSAAYALLFIRVALWHRRAGRALLRRSPPLTRALASWHVWPMAIWFLWPQKLAAFLWVNSPTANPGDAPQHSLLGGYGYYWQCLARDYHVGAWSALLVLGLMAVAVVACLRGRLRPGASAILWLLLVACVLTAQHPNRKSRFLHSWVPAVWVAAGVGAGCLAGRRPVLVALATGLMAAHLPGLWAPAHAPEGGVHPQSRSVLDVTDAYLPALADSQRAAVFSNVPMKFLAQWTYLQRYGRARRLETETPDGVPAFQNWLGTTPCDTVVYVDFPPGTAFSANAPGAEGLARFGPLLERQTTFTLVERITFPDNGSVVTVWRRTP